MAKEIIEMLDNKEKLVNEKLKEIQTISKTLMNDELTLLDIVANEDQLENSCLELQELLKEIIQLREWQELERLESEIH